MGLVITGLWFYGKTRLGETGSLASASPANRFKPVPSTSPTRTPREPEARPQPVLEHAHSRRGGLGHPELRDLRAAGGNGEGGRARTRAEWLRRGPARGAAGTPVAGSGFHSFILGTD